MELARRLAGRGEGETGRAGLLLIALSALVGFGLGASLLLFRSFEQPQTQVPVASTNEKSGVPARKKRGRDSGRRPESYELSFIDEGIKRRRRSEVEGRWKAARERPEERSSEELREKMASLEAIGYASGVQLSGSESGITAYDPSRAQPGLNLYVSGHAREAILMDMEGEVLHTWSCAPMPTEDPRHEQDFLGAAHLLDNGELLVLLGTTGLVKLDRDSKVIWELANGSHHDLFLAQDGTIHVLTREVKLVPEINETEPVLLDYIVVLDQDGHELDRTSIYQAFADSPFSPSLDHAPPYGDFLHTNTIEVSDGSLADRSPAFRKGNVLISLKFMSTIAMVDLETKRVVWTMTGLWKWQHRPTILENGNMLIVDNLGGREELGHSRILEFDPFSRELDFVYEGHVGNEFSTRHSGAVDRLPNGNTLIIETGGRRALEVTAEGEIVWEFINPHRSGDNDELIASLFDLVRLPQDQPMEWLTATDADR